KGSPTAGIPSLALRARAVFARVAHAFRSGGARPRGPPAPSPIGGPRRLDPPSIRLCATRVQTALVRPLPSSCPECATRAKTALELVDRSLAEDQAADDGVDPGQRSEAQLDVTRDLPA